MRNVMVPLDRNQPTPPGSPTPSHGVRASEHYAARMSGVILQTHPLGFPWETLDPFLFCLPHDDA